MTIVNLTPHALNIVMKNGDIRTVAPSGDVARVAASQTQIGEVHGIPLFLTTFGEVIGLPDPVPGVCYVVSALVRAAVSERKDVLSPGDLVRDAEGNVVGCKGLISN